MRIFCAVRHANDPKHYYGGLWSRNFYPALRQLGHETVESQVDLFPTSRFMQVASDFTSQEREARARTTQQILAEVRAAHRQAPVHLFLSYFYNAHFDPAGFDELRRLGILSVNFYCNSIYQFQYVAAVAAKADFSWHAERDARATYLAVGAHPVWVQMAADPNVYYPIEGMARQPKACFVGQRYADRDRWLAALVRAGVPVDIYGSGWGGPVQAPSDAAPATEDSYLGRKLHRPGGVASLATAMRKRVEQEGLFRGSAGLVRQWNYRRSTRKLSPLLQGNAKGWAGKISATFAAYEICLNFSNVWADGRPGSALIPHVRLRDFEAPMCRTCFLTGHTDEIAEFYDIGKEIDTYQSEQELVDKTRYYLANLQAAERLRTAGYERARRDHTWVRRFQQLLQAIGLRYSA